MNLDSQYVSYGSHHNNKVNKGIHFICVPLILWSFVVITTHYFGTLMDASLIPVVGQYIQQIGGVTVGFLWMFFNLVFYFTLEPLASALLAPALFGLVYLANQFHSSNSNATTLAFGVHIAGWAAQFVGHYVYEKRRPKLFDNVIQSLSLSALFVWLEFLFMLGYRRQLSGRLQGKVGTEVARLIKAAEKRFNYNQ